MSVQYGFEASPKWHAENPGAMDAVGNFLLEQNAASIMSWLQGQRQNARNSQLMIYNSQFRLPGIRAQYTKRFGYETLRLVAQPENAGGKLPRQITIPLSDTVLVKPKFIGYPIPGAAGKQGNIAGGCSWWNLPTMSIEPYFYEFGSTPGFPDTEKPITDVGSFTFSDITFGPSSGPMLQAYSTDTPFSYTDDPDDPRTIGGFNDKTRQAIGAGSKIHTTAINPSVGTYFEVWIEQLNTSVPATVVRSPPFGAGDPGTWVSSEVFFATNGDDVERFYPKDLNTWWTPAVGIMPESMVAKDSRGKAVTSTPAILGMEREMSTPRSIWTARTSYMRGTNHSQSWQARGYTAIILDGAFAGGVAIICGPNPVTEHNPYSAPSTDHSFLPNAQAIGFNGTFLNLGGNYFGDLGPGGSFLGNVGDVLTRLPTDVPFFFGQITLPNDCLNCRLGYIPSFMDIHDIPTVIGDFVATEFTTDPYVLDGLRDNTGWYGLPPGKTEGRFSPVHKGRADNTQSLLPADDYPLDTTSEFPWNGCFSGVELGDWQEGDVIRVAIIKGKIWFGRNKRWYWCDGDKVVQSTEDDLPGSGANWALIVDKDPATDAYPNYYAAVSWRVGGMQATIRGGAAVKYAPPKGCKALTSSPTPITIQLPA